MMRESALVTPWRPVRTISGSGAPSSGTSASWRSSTMRRPRPHAARRLSDSYSRQQDRVAELARMARVIGA
jgi:hypothetical protein